LGTKVGGLSKRGKERPGKKMRMIHGRGDTIAWGTMARQKSALGKEEVNAKKLETR